METYDELMTATRFYIVLLIANGVISTALYVFTMMTIMLKTPKTNFCPRVKFVLLAWTTSGYNVALIIALWQPVALFPYSFGFSVGVLRNSTDFWNSIAHAIFIASVMNFFLCFFVFTAYQNSSLTHRCKFGRYLRETSPARSAVLYVVILIFIMICGISMMMSVRDSSISLDKIISGNMNHNAINVEKSVLMMLATVHEKEPSMQGFYHIGHEFGLMHIYLTIFIFFGVFIFCFIFYIHIKIGQEISELEGVVRRETHDLQVKLFRAYTSTTLLLFVFYFAPLILISLCIFDIVRGLYWPMIIFLCMAVYTPVFLGRIIWRIPPYRRHMTHVVHQVFQRTKTFNTVTAVTSSMQISASYNDNTSKTVVRTQ